MAFDGITIAALTDELNTRLSQGHIRKIAQPEADELLLTIQTPAPARETLRLKLSANASLPLLYLTSENKPSPLTAPNFCMLLRKHLSGSAITGVTQEGMERVVRIHLSGKNELGDEVAYSLVIEIMGKHSNIIFLNESDKIIDSIKHVNSLMSSVREVLPGRDYFIPNTMEKLSPDNVSIKDWNQTIFNKPTSVAKAIAGSMSGISQIMAQELCYRAGIDGDAPTASLNGNDRSALMDEFRSMMQILSGHEFSPVIYYENDVPKEFSVVSMKLFDGLHSESDTSPSAIVERFYREKDSMTRIRSKSAELKSTVQTHFERTAKKLGILKKQLADTEKKDKYQIYGELITTYG